MKRALDFICFVGGVFLTVYFLFDFSVGPIGPVLLTKDAHPFYFYSQTAQIGIALGASLICLGFVRRL